MELDPTKRFSQRADVYARYRPRYPAALTALLETQCGLHPGAVVADIGCGTGLLAQPLLDYGCAVIGVEPNAAMRETGAQFLAGEARFRMGEGRAEATGLAPATADFVTAGQAFHWFDPRSTRAEFQRILKPGGWTVLVWNERTPATEGLMADYAQIVVRYAPEQGRIDRAAIALLFGGDFAEARLDNYQTLDRAGLHGRLSSSSYAPLPGTDGHGEMIESLDRLFDRYQSNQTVTLLYDTLVYYGQLGNGTMK